MPDMMMLNVGVHPEAVCSLLQESGIKGRINLPSDFCARGARGARQQSVEGPDMGSQVLYNALREHAARSERIGCRQAASWHIW